MRLPRWMHRIYAAMAGYFWIPCPVCGFMFGGHEFSGAILRAKEDTDGSVLCFNHEPGDYLKQGDDPTGLWGRYLWLPKGGGQVQVLIYKGEGIA